MQEQALVVDVCGCAVRALVELLPRGGEDVRMDFVRVLETRI